MGRAVELKQWLNAAQKEEAGEAALDQSKAAEPCPFVGCVTKDGIKLALGEKLDIWPKSIREMAEEEWPNEQLDTCSQEAIRRGCGG